MKQISLSLLVTLGVAAGALRAQGTDACTTPTVITGTGLFNFDNTTATTGPQGQTEAICNILTSAAILQDVWFTWTAPTSGVVIVETCNITGVDTKIAIYDGATCPTGGALACSEDDCSIGYQSSLSALVVGGNSYVIQLGLYPGQFPVATPGTGQFSVNVFQPPAHDDCNTPMPIAGPGTFNVNNTLATTGAQGQTEAACTFFGFTTVVNDVWFTYTPTTNGTVTITTCGVPVASQNDDSKIAVYTGAGCPAPGTNVACNDDNCPSSPQFGYESTMSFTAVCGTTYTIQFGMYGGSGPADFYNGDVTITETGGTTCSTPAVTFCDGSSVGTTCTACGNNGSAGRGCANSSFASGALLANTGNASVGTDTLVLTASDVTGPGLFFQSNGLGGTVMFGDGMLCASVGIARMGVVFPTAGSASYPGGSTPAPITIAGGPIVAGDIKHYQCWYRDAIVFCTGATFNLTNGLSITWAP